MTVCVFALSGMLFAAQTPGQTRTVGAASQDAPPADEVAPAAPAIVASEAEIRIEGLSEGRFNPTHGTVFFTILGADFPVEPQDVAVLINERQLPVQQVSLSRRIVTASYAMPEGLNEVILRAWDPEGELVSADTLVWAGDGVLVIDVVDIAGQPVDGATVTVHLANQRSVQATVEAPGGVARFVNLPTENVAVEAVHPDGRSGTLSLSPAEQRAVLVLR